MSSPPRFFAGLPFRLPTGFRWMAIAWLVAETLVFLALVQTIGFGGTVLLGLATTVLGIVMMRRVGLEALRGMQGAFTGPGSGNDKLLDGLLSAGGALLLIVPGFIANAAGLALAAPSARRAVIGRFGGSDRRVAGRPVRQDVIDLGPDDWRSVDRG